MRSTADPGIGSSITAQSHTFVEIDHETISSIILLLPLIQEGFGILGQVWYLIVLIPDLCTLTYFVDNYKRMYVHKVLVNRLVKLAQEKVWLGKLTVST